MKDCSIAKETWAIAPKLNERLSEVQLNEPHPHAVAVADGLAQLLAHFGHP